VGLVNWTGMYLKYQFIRSAEELYGVFGWHV